MLTILGLLAIYLDPIVGTVDIVPDAVGYGLISISLLVYNRKCSGGIRTVCLLSLIHISPSNWIRDSSLLNPVLLSGHPYIKLLPFGKCVPIPDPDAFLRL